MNTSKVSIGSLLQDKARALISNVEKARAREKEERCVQFIQNAKKAWTDALLWLSEKDPSTSTYLYKDFGTLRGTEPSIIISESDGRLEVKMQGLYCPGNKEVCFREIVKWLDETHGVNPETVGPITINVSSPAIPSISFTLG